MSFEDDFPSLKYKYFGSYGFDFLNNGEMRLVGLEVPENDRFVRVPEVRAYCLDKQIVRDALIKQEQHDKKRMDVFREELGL